MNATFIVGTNVLRNKREAIQTAYKLNLTSVYDSQNSDVIQLPTPQRSGTTTQQKAYINSVIDRLCK